MKKVFLFSMAALLLCGGRLFAGSVSVADAQTVALNFFKLTMKNGGGRNSLSATLAYTKTEADRTIDFYVFDIKPANGFVIVAADNIVKPVIAYSTESYFDVNFTKSGVSNWVNHYGTRIYRAIKANNIAAERTTELWSAYLQGENPGTAKSGVVLPLVKTIWNQEPLYNALCPYDSTDQQRAVTGCVATSMAQVMKFWNYPKQGTGSYSYSCYNYTRHDNYNYGTQSADFGSTTYQWTKMQNNVVSPDTAVAVLMYQCGVSVGMNYGDDNQDGSSATVLEQDAYGGPNSQDAFTTYFGYDPGPIQGVVQSFYSDNDWSSLLQNELNAGRPLIYTGQDPTSGGHAWVCDGYDVNGLFHMNWGWGGSSNGYYAVDSLMPAGTGLDFSNYEEALIGIQPIMPVLQLTASATKVCSGDTCYLTATASPGVTYSWSPATGLSCTNCANPSALPTATTTYTVIVDSSGYQASASVTINVSGEVVATNDSSSGPTCYGGSNGYAAVSALLGVGPFHFAWSTGASTATVTNLSAGDYTVTVSDASGCSAVAFQAIYQPAQIIVTPQLTDATGCTTANGGAALSVTGGSGSGYSYAWAEGSTTNAISNVAPGQYPVTVTDSHNCTTVTDVVVRGPYDIIVDITENNAIGADDNGSATVESVNDGTSPYNYLWSNGSTNAWVSNLAPGAYELTVTDKNGCQSFDSVTISDNAPTAISPVNEPLSFTVYPNPARSNLTVQLSKVESGTTLLLENILGQTLVSKPVSELQMQLNLSQFPGGVYLLELRQGEERAVKQIVISR